MNKIIVLLLPLMILLSGCTNTYEKAAESEKKTAQSYEDAAESDKKAAELDEKTSKSDEKAAELEEKAAESETIFTDSLSRTVRIKSTKRVVAASGSLAEIWLLSGGNLVGTTDDAFDGRLKLSDDVQNIGKLHQLSVEILIDLKPDLIIFSAETASQVKLCEAVESAGIPAVYLSVKSFDDYLSSLEKFTEITDRLDLYKQNGLDVKEKINNITLEIANKNSPKILLLRANSSKVEAQNSLTLAGIILKDMGAENIADSDTGILENLSMEVIIKENPDYIFVVFQGEDETAARKILNQTLTSNPAWSSLSAVKSGNFIILPKEIFHQKPNSRWDEAYKLIWEILYEKE